MTTSERHDAALGQVLELAILLNDDMTRALARDGLTVARTHLLWELHQRGPSTQRVLADALGVSPRNITGLVDGLVATGFVTREPHPADRRRTELVLTDSGRGEVVGHLMPMLVALDQLDRGFRRLSPDQRVVIVLHHYLGLSLAESAAALAIPLGTMQSRLSRATQSMRAALDADERPAAGAMEVAR